MAAHLPPSSGVVSREALWSDLSTDLRRYIARRVRPDDVDDVLQTVFLRLHAQLPSLRDEDRLLGWVYTVTRNVITDHYRRASTRREVVVAELPAELADDEREDDVTAEAELATCLRPLLGGLPAEQGAALELVELRGLTQVEAARVAGVTVSGMKSRVQRGRARLRELLLHCCSVERDVRGRVQDWQPRRASCECG